jgi:hypothetical protein
MIRYRANPFWSDLCEDFFSTIGLGTTAFNHVNSDGVSGIFRPLDRFSVPVSVLFTALLLVQVVAGSEGTTKRKLVHNP